MRYIAGETRTDSLPMFFFRLKQMHIDIRGKPTKIYIHQLCADTGYNP